MAVIVTKPDKYAKCIWCGSDLHNIHEFQFFQDIGMKVRITVCKPCEYHMLDMITEGTVDKMEVV